MNSDHEPPRLKFAPGDQVRSRADAGKIGVVRSIGAHHGGIQYYKVFWAGTGDTRETGEIDLLPFLEASSPGDSLVAGHFTGYRDFQRVVTFQRIRRDRLLRNNVYAFNASRTRFYPYQFKPLLKFLDSPNHRILICDEVGLGKTIEAGLILTELRARSELRSVLVLCPSNLRHKWKLELSRRFAEDFRILTAKDLISFAEDSAESSQALFLNGIASYDTLRSKHVLQAIEELAPPFDLVVADEAHHMRNFSTRTRRAGVAVASNAAALVMLTATPVHLGDENLFSLLQILDDEDFPDYPTTKRRFRENESVVRAQRLLGRSPPDVPGAADAIEVAAASPWLVDHPIMPRLRANLSSRRSPATMDRSALYRLQADLADINLIGHLFSRTRRRDVHLNIAIRRPQAVEIEFSPIEQTFYDAVTAFVRARAEAAANHPVIVKWRINSIQRRAASSIPALVEHFRAGGLAEGPGDTEEDDTPSWDSTGEDSEGFNTKEEWDELSVIVAEWPVNAPDSKYDRLLEAIRGIHAAGLSRKLIVFAFFRGTLKYLARRLRADGVEVLLLHGEIPVEERTPIIDRFRVDPAIRVLLSSRIGSEGLDFQFCDTVVNYDLPWNPMEVEQRIGRIDRIGQSAPVIHILNLWTRGSIEERILRRLYERIGVFERSIGSLDAILGDVMHQIERLLLRSELAPIEVEAEADRAAQAIENQIRQAEEVEGQAAALVGLDDFFGEEIKLIHSNRRYVTPGQLHKYVEDFLREKAPGARLSYDDANNCGKLVLDADLKRFLQEGGWGGEAFVLLGSGLAGVPITFDGQKAFESPSIEFLSILHPLVRAITTFHALQDRGATTAHHVRVVTTRLPPGTYLFAIFRQTTVAVRETSTLESLFLDSDLRVVRDGLDAEALVGEMVEQGGDPVGGPLSVDDSFAHRGLAAAKAAFLDRLALVRQRVEEENGLFVERRLASLRVSYNKHMGRIQSLLDKGLEKERQERYLRMLRSQLTRLQSELVAKESSLHGMRAVQMEYEEVAVGVVEIEQPEGEW
jgi:superfamily II DNA or RNA helicase